jgi:predicted porin
VFCKKRFGNPLNLLEFVMKKSLIALAVLAASGASFAQSSVTLYGIADVWVGSLKVGDVRTTKLDSGGVSASRFGFKGSEDLGGGLKANFLLEQGFSIDSGASATAGQAFSRQSYVGLSGGFGEVRLGKSFTAYDDLSGATNSGFDSALSANAGIWKSTGYNANPSNGVYYATPAMGGVSAAVSYSLDEKVALAPQVTSFNVAYAGGPLTAGVAYQVEEFNGLAVKSKFTRLNAAYDLGVAKLLAGYGRADILSTRTNEWQIGADFPVTTALTLSGGFARSKDDANATSGVVTRNGAGLAAAYSLSKRTALYAGFRVDRTKNVDAADVNLYAVGVKHTF